MKQIIKIFSKCDAYRNAHEQINKLMNGIFKAEIENGQISIEKYTDTTMAAQVDYCTETAVVVLDARQTRVLITPKQRDSLDQWTDLHKLSETTKPKGSIIIIIYGDRSSKGLKENQILHDQWHRAFKFKDEHAEYGLLQHRCFSLWENFNDFQKTTLRHYIHEIALFPSIDSVSDILVVGNDDQIQTFRKYLRCHPFLHLRRQPSSAADDLFSPSYTAAEDGSSILRVYYYESWVDMPIKVCEQHNARTPKELYPTKGELWKEKEGWLVVTATPPRTLEEACKETNRSMMSTSGDTLPAFDRVILLCRDCETCFKNICDHRYLVRDCIVHHLESKNLRVSGDVLPLSVGERPKTKQEQDTVLEIMSNFPRWNHLYEKTTKFQSCVSDDRWLTKMYIMYLCHSGSQHNQNDNAMKQLIKIFTKPESNNTAYENVGKLLHGVFKEEIESAKLFIEKYTDSARTPTVNYKTETLLVVFDARQTRVLITPRRRDAAVDLWNELQMFAQNSKPNGSIIIVIYGDESSRGLKEDQILHDKWHRLFTFSDDLAEQLLLQDRCFSLDREFSDFQKRALRYYMHEVALFPPFESMSNVLVVGNHDQTEMFRKYLCRHPFLHLRSFDSVEHQGVTADELLQPSYETALDRKSILRAYYYNNVVNLPVKVCKRRTLETFRELYPTEDDLWEEVDGWLRLRPASSEVDEETRDIVKRLVIMISKFASTVWSSDSLLPDAGRDTLPVFNRVILLCHDCETCFQQIYNQRHLVSDCAAKCLEWKFLKIRPDVLPLALGDRPKTKQEKDTMLEIMANFSRYDHPDVFNMVRNDSSLLENDDKWLTKMYIMYLCHSVYPYIPGDDEDDDKNVQPSSVLCPSIRHTADDDKNRQSFTDLCPSIRHTADDDKNRQSFTDRKEEITRCIQEAILDTPRN